MKTFKQIGITTALVILLAMSNGFGYSNLIAQRVQYTNPLWAPAYYPGVRYYYIPDIEAFYDISNQDFVYLDDGQWLFSSTLPSMYSWYDLYSGFVVALDLNVFQPWRHFHFYVSNYPRFYYRNLYNKTEIATIRGFNENERKPFYWTQVDRNRMTELRGKDNTERKAHSTRPPQAINYYGKNIGQPVKVQHQMKENKQDKQIKKQDNQETKQGNQDNRRGNINQEKKQSNQEQNRRQ